MSQVTLLFHGSLRELLESPFSQRPVLYSFKNRPTVKHVFESLGVPHTEVGEVRANGRPVATSYILKDGDLIEIDPQPEPAPAPEPDPRFLLDNHLGKLASYLRMLGFDAAYRNDYDDAYLADQCAREGRILLSRDRRLLMRKIVTRGCCIRSLEPRTQVKQVMLRFNLYGQVQPFLRCIRCNGLLEQVGKDRVLSQLEPLTRRYFDEFRRCQDCEKVYWRGSHYERMRGMIQEMRRSTGV